MDDYNLGILIESKNEWCARLINVLVSPITEGFTSIFQEAYKLCIENDEESKYLMTFQNLLNNISKWSEDLIETEKQRILTQTGCPYLEDLLTCVHIIQLKALSCARVGIENKKINIDIPNINVFIHKTYINAARKIYINIYLFEKDIPPLQIQKNNRELEHIIKESILDTVRANIPVEIILRAYLDETQETDVKVVERQEVVVDKEALKKKQQDEERAKEIEKIREEVRQEFILKEKNKIDNSIEKINETLNLNNGLVEQQQDKPQIHDNNSVMQVTKPVKQDNVLDDNLQLDILDLSDKDEFNDNLDNDNADDEIELDIEEL